MLGLAVVTVAGAVPRSVRLTVLVLDPVEPGPRVRTVVTEGGDVVAEAEELVRPGGPTRLEYRFRLAATEHEVEVHAPGCLPLRRRFTPGESETVALRYPCRGRGPSD